MPTYSFRNTETEEVQTHLFSLEEREKFLKENPKFVQILAAPVLGDSVRLGVTKTADGFNDLLKHVKSSHLHSTIETKN